ncbi:hypothetical protein LCGC14_1963080 [marine sediment metagenome]|uniref:Uncharacterized protein n=1 Tax=marine sediment metagenome TaxID=412755 RepID=A0A0F9HSE9_9ZZZZ
MFIIWFWCLNCDGTHTGQKTGLIIPHKMPFKGERVKERKCKSCGGDGATYRSLQEA